MIEIIFKSLKFESLSPPFFPLKVYLPISGVAVQHGQCKLFTPLN